jgi:hypothetical protein
MTRAETIKMRLKEIETEMESLGAPDASLDDVSRGMQQLTNEEKWEERRSKLAKEMRVLLRELDRLPKHNKPDRSR